MYRSIAADCRRDDHLPVLDRQAGARERDAVEHEVD
jgi:hypothetical protein